MEELGIGSVIYLRDENSRKYDERGHAIEALHFVPRPIESETTRSWIVNYRGYKFKIDKKTLRYKSPGFGLDGQVYTAKTRDDYLWLREYRYELVKKIQNGNDIEKIRRCWEIMES